MATASEIQTVEDGLFAAALEVVYHMTSHESKLPKAHFEKWFRPRLRLALLDVQILEAKRCEAYGAIGSPRVMELKAARNKVAIEVAKLDAEKRKP